MSPRSLTLALDVATNERSNGLRAGILYYSMTGNSALAARRLAAGLPFECELIDMTAPGAPDLATFDALAVVCSTDFWDVPPFVLHFFGQLSGQQGKPAVVVNTYGGVSGRTLPRLGQALSAAGLRVVAGFSLHMPASYPPLIAAGVTAASAPSQSHAARYDAFIEQAGALLVAWFADSTSASARLRTTLGDKIVGQAGRLVPRGLIARKTISTSDCVGCGTCVRGCPVRAIDAGAPPIFRPRECVGCWRCYNRCPQHAIQAGWLRGTPFYGGPTDDLLVRLAPPAPGPGSTPDN